MMLSSTDAIADAPARPGGVSVDAEVDVRIESPVKVVTTHSTHSDENYTRPRLPNDSRVRFGVDLSAGLGTILGGPFPTSEFAAKALVLNAAMRLGWQFNNFFALYYQGNLPLAYAWGDGEDDQGAMRHYAGAAVVATSALMAEVSDDRVAHAGIGIGVDRVLQGVCTEGGGAQDCAIPPGLAFGLHVRLSITAGIRRGKSIGIDLHNSFTGDGVLIITTFGFGYEWH
jgi:hypothetical protein